ncbi:uncharacterized protein LOC127288684 isoform X5 [Leptopilina boulardi]|uniref:uncharacterized protein LOC127288684 isoform X5 n=1 Tax=Leptopilina boulardi TaxID=63433 RepID=UPI0021F624F4|nr:uncharacterized protein LOC127288684 isoform X5 [Leptopilina boulardi]
MVKIRFIAAAFGASMGMFSLGTYVGWASPTIPKLLKDNSPIKLNPDEASLAISLLKAGNALGCIISIFLVDFIGRKGTIIISIIPTTIGWIIILFAKSAMQELWVVSQMDYRQQLFQCILRKFLQLQLEAQLNLVQYY